MWSGWINKLVYCFEKKNPNLFIILPSLCPQSLWSSKSISDSYWHARGKRAVFFVKSTRLHMPTAKKTKIVNKEFWKTSYPFTEISTWVNTRYHKLPAISNTKINIMKRASYFNIIYSYTTVISLNLASDLYIQ